ncbi:hypothetical protein [Paenibacillus naphthalenovorans]|uniref:phage lytic cycle repressor MrpR family protein n=1 Tax=Paenibacillus naphthalenovorans TaxID=162209 RepID=UPI003D26B500
MTKLTLENLYFIERQCLNPQDAIIIRLLMEGVEIHEIVYLKKDSLDGSNRILTVIDCLEQKRTIKVSERCAELYQNAVKQTHYFFYNDDDPAHRKSVTLKDSPYLIRVCLKDYIANESMIIELDSVILRTIYTRLRSLASFFSLPQISYLTTVRLDMAQKVFA